MKNPNSFLVKNKKSLLIGGGIVILGGTAYAIFGYKGSDGRTAFQRWVKSEEGRSKESGEGGELSSGAGDIDNLTNRPINEENIEPIGSSGIASCKRISLMTRIELLKALGMTAAPPLISDSLLRTQLRQKLNCGGLNFSGAMDASLKDFILSQGKEINLFL